IWVSRDTEAGAHHGLIVGAVGQADAGREHDRDGIGSRGSRDVAAATDQHLIVVRIIPLDAVLAAVHNGEVLYAQAKVKAQLSTRLPVVADVIALLELARRHGVVELVGLAHGSRQAQQERRVGIEVVRRSTGVQGGYAVDEIEASPRAPAARFRLPVVHLVLDHVDSEPKIMGASGPVQVDSVGVLPVIAFHRAPIILVAEPAVTADIEDREATLADVGTVGAGNLQYVEADVRAVIRTL